MTLRPVPDHVRPCAVAGLFYPARAKDLAAMVDRLLDAAAATEEPPLAEAPLAIVVPHAGYVYSGAIAAAAWSLLRPVREQVERVVVVGPAHRVPVAGIATTSADAFATPLGIVAVDAEMRCLLSKHSAVHVDDRAHACEHCVEVQLPFLQRAVGDVGIVPLVAGRASPEVVADVLRPAWEQPHTVIVVSTDLSHYLDDCAARLVDAQTAAAIVAADADAIKPSDACGAVPLRGLLALASASGARVRRLAVGTSADSAGDPERVVGYGAFAVVRS